MDMGLDEIIIIVVTIILVVVLVAVMFFLFNNNSNIFFHLLNDKTGIKAPVGLLTSLKLKKLL